MPQSGCLWSLKRLWFVSPLFVFPGGCAHSLKNKSSGYKVVQRETVRTRLPLNYKKASAAAVEVASEGAV